MLLGANYLYLRFPGEGTSGEMGRSLSAQIHAVTRALVASELPGLLDVVPGYDTLLVEFDPGLIDADTLRGLVDASRDDGGPLSGARAVTLDTVYDGPDLEEVAQRAGLSVAEVIRRHADIDYFVYALGFTPGFPFMGDVDPAIRTPRRDEPRKHVPAGSVGIADAQTGVYPSASPGGWRLLGRTASLMYDPRRDAPFLLEPGDTVRFKSVETAAPVGEPSPIELLPEEPRAPTFLVRAGGLLDLVLDAGRPLVGRYGLARGGPLDKVSARIANALVGNPADAPLLEMSVLGPTLEALRDVVIAFTGGGVAPRLDGAPLPPYLSALVRKGARLQFLPGGSGRSGYLALAGGIEAASFMGSACVDMRGMIGRPLREGDVIGTARDVRPRRPFAFSPYRRAEQTLRVRLLPGPQFDPDSMQALTERPLRIESADRMGIRLSPTSALGTGIRSEGNPLGAVQLTSDGHPLVLLNDRGTMGGYTKPALVDPRDLPKLVQARDGAWVSFLAATRQ